MKVGNRSKIGNREQRMQARFEKLVAKVGELEKENASLRFQVKSNKEAFDWARCQAHLNRLVDANKDLKADLARQKEQLEKSNKMHDLRENSFS